MLVPDRRPCYWGSRVEGVRVRVCVWLIVIKRLESILTEFYSQVFGRKVEFVHWQTRLNPFQNVI